MASTYSTISELLLGDIQVSTSTPRQKFVDDAANEIDSILGRRYDTPLDVSDTSVMPRYARLFVKRAANNLATGRLILALASAGEDVTIHAYGLSLVNNALMALESIACGEYDLPGVQETTPSTRVRGPKIINVDPFSGVSAYYQRFSDPFAPVFTDPLIGGAWRPGVG